MNDHHAIENEVPQMPLREPDMVMRLSRLGAFYPTRLSFMRSLIRQLSTEKVDVRRPVWEIDEAGYGRAVYAITLGGYVYSLVAFSTRLSPDQRTDRVIAEAWDTSYALFDGVPTVDDLDRLEANAPRQEAGRFSATELVISRANKSVRFFDHVVDRLAHGLQPDRSLVDSVGYLMRTTAVYGNGKFGIADRARIEGRSQLSGSFQAEMLTVWLIRGFSVDLVEHIARCRSPEKSVLLDRDLKRHLGIGNSTGLGMAPFLVTHPILLNNWIISRETALARVRAIKQAAPDRIERVLALMLRARKHLLQWSVPDERQMQRVTILRNEWDALIGVVTSQWLEADYPWERMMALSQERSQECQELMVSLLLEFNGDLVDGLTDCMVATNEPRLVASMTVAALRALCARHFDWTLKIDFTDRRQTNQFWYVSEEKLEPRLGNRYEEPGSELEMPLDIARQVQALDHDLAAFDDTKKIAEFLIANPKHREAARRVQCAELHPYSEIRDNLLADDSLPIDMLRCKLSFFGASKFDPKSDRWTRITLYQGAPLLDEITGENADDWWLPVLT